LPSMTAFRLKRAVGTTDTQTANACVSASDWSYLREKATDAPSSLFGTNSRSAAKFHSCFSSPIAAEAGEPVGSLRHMSSS